MYNLSVLISTCDKDNPVYLGQAVRSIYRQTIKPKEIVLVVDGYINEVLRETIGNLKMETVCSFKVVQLDENVGLGRALNAGIMECTCEWVARMDSDDIAREDRFEKQFDLISRGLKVDVMGSYIEECDEKMNCVLRVRKVPLDHDDIARHLRWKNPMNHMTVMFRKSDVMAVGGYPFGLRKLQDYGLWAKMIKAGYRFKNIPESLVLVRAGEDFLKRRGGIGYFQYEVAVLRYLKGIGNIGFMCFWVNFFVRFIARISPVWIRGLIYRGMRSS